MALSDRFSDALVYAADKHRLQLRKGSKTPYVSHLLQVTGLALEHGADEEVAIAAVLHDVIEDCGRECHDEIHDRFGNRVLEIVVKCSDTLDKEADDRSWLDRKQDYIRHLQQENSVDVLLVSCCDKIHNTRSILSDLKEKGESAWDIFAGKKEGTLWYYRALVDTYRQTCAPSRLVRELSEIMAEIELLANEDG